jgi:hypothetical protein
MKTCRGIVFGVCALLVSVFVPPAFAADPPPTGGVELGVNVNSERLSGSKVNGVDNGSKAGVYGGAFITIPVGSTVAIQPEAAYSQRHFTLSAEDHSFSATEALDFVEIPVLAKIHLHAASGLYFVAGPAVSLTVKATSKDRRQNGVLQPDSDIKNEVRGYDYSVIGGVGLTLGQLDVEARYDLGLRDLNPPCASATDDSNCLGENLTVKQGAFTFLARWRLHR